ncbi:MAG: ribose 5-phosphate isomerase B [Bacteroidetes bacterium]|nr:ribose 5-phosphate isomerase B [Bacteroidota bacterium]
MEQLAIGCDHAGYQLKIAIIEHLKLLGYNPIDFGAPSEQSVDYPDFAHLVASAVERGEVKYGILICGSGNGISMAANKHVGIRAAVCWNSEIAELARKHNDANIISLPARFVTLAEASSCITIFLKTDFEGGRHATRVNKIKI